MFFSAMGVAGAQIPQQSLELSRKQGTAGNEDLPVIEDLRLFEAEMGFGVNFSSPREGMKTRPGTNFFGELRLNRPEPWDVALQFKGANFKYVAGGGVSVRSTAIAPTLFVDHNLRFNRQTRFFAGIGIGGDFVRNQTVIPTGSSSGIMFDRSANAFAVTPRVGVSVFNFLRVTAEYTVATHDRSRFGVNIGLVLGGSYRSTYVDRRSGRQKFWEDTAPAIINSLVP